MTDDRILDLARQAIRESCGERPTLECAEMVLAVKRAIRTAIAEEREACAKLCERAEETPHTSGAGLSMRDKVGEQR